MHYSISINPSRLKDPKQTREYFRGIIDAVSNDAYKRGGLEHLAISINRGNLRRSKSDTQELLDSAREDVKKNNCLPWDEKSVGISSLVGAGAVGIFGLVSGYYISTE